MSLRYLMLTSLCAFPLLAQPLTQGERDRALSSLHGSRKMMVDAVTGLSKEQLTFKPAPEVWSVGEIMEHLALIEEGIYTTAAVDALKTPVATSAQQADARKKDEIILKMVPERTQKAQAPESFRPPGRFKSPQEGLAAFKTDRDRSCAFIRETQEPLRAHMMPNPVLGPMDAYQWFLFLGAHTERHVAQILEVKANANFPKK